MSDVANRLKRIRQEKHLTQVAFGELVGVTKQAIANIESSHSNPSIELMSKLFDILNVNLNYLITGKGDMFNSVNEQQPPLNIDIEQEVVAVMKKYGLIDKQV